MGIDVIMPVYGDAPFLDIAIQSVLKQSKVKFQLYVVLDRPDPNQESVLCMKYKNHANITIVASTGSGLVDALNYGVSLGGNDYIARIDSDDVMVENRLYEQEEFLKSNSDYICVGSQLQFIGMEGEHLGQTRYPLDFKTIRKKLVVQNCIAHPSVCFTREAFEKVGGYRRSYTGAEDYDLWLRMSKIGKIKNLNSKLTCYRFSPNQYSRTLGNYQNLVEDLSRIDFFAKSSIPNISNAQKIYSETELSIIVRNALDELKTTNRPDWRKVLMARKLSACMRLLAQRPRTFSVILDISINLLQAFISRPIDFLRFIIQLVNTKSKKVT